MQRFSVGRTKDVPSSIRADESAQARGLVVSLSTPVWAQGRERQVLQFLTAADRAEH